MKRYELSPGAYIEYRDKPTRRFYYIKDGMCLDMSSVPFDKEDANAFMYTAAFLELALSYSRDSITTGAANHFLSELSGLPCDINTVFCGHMAYTERTFCKYSKGLMAGERTIALITGFLTMSRIYLNDAMHVMLYPRPTTKRQARQGLITHLALLGIRFDANGKLTMPDDICDCPKRPSKVCTRDGLLRLKIL